MDIARRRELASRLLEGYVHGPAAASPLTDFIDLSQPPHFATPAPLPRPAIWPFTGRR